MKRNVFFAYGLVAYVCFLATFLYAIGFVENRIVPKSIDSGDAGPLGTAILINVLLLGLFGVQHSIMARPAFKKWWTRFVPQPIERSTYVLATCIVLPLMMWQWRPIGGTIWQVEQPWGLVLTGIALAGWLLVLYSTFVIDHFDLFGLRQVYLQLRGVEYTNSAFQVKTVYRFVRHPLMLGFMIAFWFTPHMTSGHLLFAIVTTAYVLVAIMLEERDLLAMLGPDYAEYRRRTPMLLPFLKGRPAAPPSGEPGG